MSKFLLIFLVFAIFAKSVNSANILYVAAIASPSHYIWNKALSLGLVANGHNVTIITPDNEKTAAKLPANYHRIYLEDVYEGLHKNEFANYVDFGSPTPSEAVNIFSDWGELQCNLNLESNGTHQILNYPDNYQFDAIIFDITIPTCFFPLIKKFNYPPTIAVSPFLLPTYASFDFGNILNPSIVPWYALAYLNRMTLTERIWNFLFTYYDIYKIQQLYKRTHEMSKKVFGDDIPSFYELQNHVSLLIANSDPLLDYPQPVPPNIILAGGLHARKGAKLPEDLQAILDNAKDGAIIFSLGTNIRSDQIGEANIRAFVEAFSRLKQTILWKFESDIKDLPKNVIVRKWLPQNDLLAHPNVRLFIGHGGALSTQEGVYHGLPMVLLPFIADQHINSKIIINKKLGKKLVFAELNADYIEKTIREVLENKSYAENAKRTSKLFKDRQETPLERAVFWVEHVIRNGGAQHLNTPARNMKFYQALNIDVFLVLALIVIVPLIVVWKLVNSVCKLVCQTKKPKVKVN